MCLPNLRTVTQLVLAQAVGNDVRDVPSEVTAAFWRSEARLFKAGNVKIRRSQNVLPVIRGIGAKEQAQGLGVEAAVVIVEKLVEVVGPEKQLVCDVRRERGVQDGRVVKDMDRGDLKVIFQLGAGRSQGRATAERSSLATLASEPAQIKVMLVCNLIVDPGNAVVAIPWFRAGAEEIVLSCRKTRNGPLP